MKLSFTVVGTAAATLFVISLSNVVQVVQATDGVATDIDIIGIPLPPYSEDNIDLKLKCQSMKQRFNCIQEIGCGWRAKKSKCSPAKSQEQYSASKRLNTKPSKCRNQGGVWKKNPSDLTGPGRCESPWKFFTLIDYKEEEIEDDDDDGEFSDAATDIAFGAAAGAAAGETTIIRNPIPVAVSVDRQLMESLVGLNADDAKTKIYSNFIKFDPITNEKRRFNIYVCDDNPNIVLSETTTTNEINNNKRQQRSNNNCTAKAHRNNRIRLFVNTNTNTVTRIPGIG